jgi:hypothetical protein
MGEQGQLFGADELAFVAPTRLSAQRMARTLRRRGCRVSRMGDDRLVTVALSEAGDDLTARAVAQRYAAQEVH